MQHAEHIPGPWGCPDSSCPWGQAGQGRSHEGPGPCPRGPALVGCSGRRLRRKSCQPSSPVGADGPDAHALPSAPAEPFCGSPRIAVVALTQGQQADQPPSSCGTTYQVAGHATDRQSRADGPHAHEPHFNQPKTHCDPAQVVSTINPSQQVLTPSKYHTSSHRCP